MNKTDLEQDLRAALQRRAGEVNPEVLLAESPIWGKRADVRVRRIRRPLVSIAATTAVLGFVAVVGVVPGLFNDRQATKKTEVAIAANPGFDPDFRLVTGSSEEGGRIDFDAPMANSSDRSMGPPKGTKVFVSRSRGLGLSATPDTAERNPVAQSGVEVVTVRGTKGSLTQSTHQSGPMWSLFWQERGWNMNLWVTSPLTGQDAVDLANAARVVTPAQWDALPTEIGQISTVGSPQRAKDFAKPDREALAAATDDGPGRLLIAQAVDEQGCVEATLEGEGSLCLPLVLGADVQRLAVESDSKALLMFGEEINYYKVSDPSRAPSKGGTADEVGAEALVSQNIWDNENHDRWMGFDLIAKPKSGTVIELYKVDEDAPDQPEPVEGDERDLTPLVHIGTYRLP